LRAMNRRNKGHIHTLNAKLSESIAIAIECQNIASELMQRSKHNTQHATTLTVATEMVTYVDIAGALRASSAKDSLQMALTKQETNILDAVDSRIESDNQTVCALRKRVADLEKEIKSKTEEIILAEMLCEVEQKEAEDFKRALATELFPEIGSAQLDAVALMHGVATLKATLLLQRDELSQHNEEQQKMRTQWNKHFETAITEQQVRGKAECAALVASQWQRCLSLMTVCRITLKDKTAQSLDECFERIWDEIVNKDTMLAEYKKAIKRSKRECTTLRTAVKKFKTRQNTKPQRRMTSRFFMVCFVLIALTGILLQIDVIQF